LQQSAKATGTTIISLDAYTNFDAIEWAKRILRLHLRFQEAYEKVLGRTLPLINSIIWRKITENLNKFDIIVGRFSVNWKENAYKLWNMALLYPSFEQ
jgi:hypothetical protein